MRRLHFIFFLVYLTMLTSKAALGQHIPYWVEASDTMQRNRALERVKALGGEVRFCSTWWPLFSVSLPPSAVRALQTEGWRLSPVQRFSNAGVCAASSADYSRALEQMQGKAFKKANLSGAGVRIGVADAGFMFLDDTVQHVELAQLFKLGQLKGMKDYCRHADTISFAPCDYIPCRKPFRLPSSKTGRLLFNLRTGSHQHGSKVLGSIAGRNPVTGFQHGLSPDAMFWLARTDMADAEPLVEEDFLVHALEWFSSASVRVVNISLGYTRGRKQRAENHSPLAMNGQGVLARAVDFAVKEKDMLVVVAAGNEGNVSAWRVLSTPGDAREALTVGAVLNDYEKAGYSSSGPSYNNYLKPEVAAYAPDGTSFSAPAVSGFAACLLELNPDLSATELKQIIMKSAHLYPYGNNYVGYGVPLASRALKLMKDTAWVSSEIVELRVPGQLFQFSDPGQLIPRVTVFHKKDAVHVIRQEIITHPKKSRGYIEVRRPAGCKRSTLQAGYRILEIFWEDGQ